MIYKLQVTGFDVGHGAFYLHAEVAGHQGIPDSTRFGTEAV